jgi:hypothetical protein
MLFFGVVMLLGTMINLYMDMDRKGTLDIGLLLVIIYIALTVVQKLWSSLKKLVGAWENCLSSW